MSADAVLEAVLKSQGRTKKSSGKGGDQENPYFFVQDSFLTEDIQVSVDNVGKLEFPLTEETVRKVIKQSNKAKFGKGEKTILDTSVRDTQMIPGEKLKVEIKPEVLSAVLSRMAKDLNVDPDSRLIPHLYNMLIYEPGQFFKEHKDSEKVDNMIATLVVLLPSPHEGGELIITHQGKKCKFSGSANHKIIHCVAFYSDCTHEVLKVTEGYRVALTYNIELNFGNDPKLGQGNPKIKEALSAYFADEEFEENPKFVYYLNHLYSEKSLNWSMLKGADRNEALALRTAATELGYLPSLALIVYHKLIETGEYGTDEDEVESDTELKTLVSENNVKYKVQEGTMYVRDDEACCSVETEELIEPKKSELQGYTGNEGQPQDWWYTRAAVVIFKSKWSFPIGFRAQLQSLHDLTRKPENQTELMKKFDENSEEFLHAQLLDDVCASDKEESDVINMLIDMAFYMNDKTRAVKIISQFSVNKTIKFVKTPKLMEMFDRVLEPASWIEILPVWKATKSHGDGRKKVKLILQTYLSSYLEKNPNDYNVHVVECLLSEIIGLLEASRSYYSWRDESSVTDRNFQEDLKYILQKLDDLRNEPLEENLSVKLRQKLSVEKIVTKNEHVNTLQEMLTPKQFSRVVGVFQEQVIDASLKDIETYRENTYTYLIDLNEARIEKFCAFFENFIKIQDPQLRVKILTRIESKPDIYTGVFITSAIDKLENVNWIEIQDFLNLSVKIIDKQLVSSEGTINWSLGYSNRCYCNFCKPVKALLSSATLKKETYLLTQHKKDHVMTSFNPSPTCPITFQVVKNKQKFNLTVDKTEKVTRDYQNLIAYLRAGKNKVTQLIQNSPAGEAGNPPPCKVQKL